MSTPAPAAGRQGRETRLLLVTIAISVGVLLLLARFRFPDDGAERPVASAPAPLERLAAEATYEELASIMADLERRVSPRVAVVRTTALAGTSSLVVAPRIAPDRAVVLSRPAERIESADESTPVEVVAHDVTNGVGVLRVPAVDDGAVLIRTGLPRTGPRYVAVVEAAAGGPILRPVYVGRIQLVADARTGAQQLSMVGLQRTLPSGAAIFALDGAFIGLVRDSGDTTTVLTGEFLRTAAGAAPPETSGARGSFGVEIDPLTPGLTRATGADRGVVIAYVQPGGPADKALQSGDVVQSVDGTQVTTVGEFRHLEGARAPGASVSIAGVRRGSALTAAVTAADADAISAIPAVEGPGIVGRHVPGAGTEIVTIGLRSAAAAAGLQAGDLIVSVDGRQAPDTADIANLYRAATPGAALLLTVRRGHRHHVLGLEKR